MSYTKRQLIEAAFSELGLASYYFDMEPEEYESALRKMDSMVAAWSVKGVRISYPLPGSPDNSDIDAESEIPDTVAEGVYLNLALRIAPGYGKVPSNETKANAREAYEILLQRAAMPQPVQLPGTMPLGAGNKQIELDRTYVTPPVDPVLAGGDGPLEFN